MRLCSVELLYTDLSNRDVQMVIIEHLEMFLLHPSLLPS